MLWEAGARSGVQAVAVLVEVYDGVLPCFPPSFDPLAVFAKEFTEQASYVLDALGQAAPMLDNGTLLALLAWPDSYRRTLLGLGVGDDAMQLSTRPRVRTPLGDSVPLHGLDVARLVYIDRIREQLAAAFRNLADIDLLKEPEPDGRGRLWTPGVIELFRFLTQQVQLAAGVRDSEVVGNVAGVALQIMQSCAPPACATYRRQHHALSPGVVFPAPRQPRTAGARGGRSHRVGEHDVSAFTCTPNAPLYFGSGRGGGAITGGVSQIVGIHRLHSSILTRSFQSFTRLGSRAQSRGPHDC